MSVKARKLAACRITAGRIAQLHAVMGMVRPPTLSVPVSLPWRQGKRPPVSTWERPPVSTWKRPFPPRERKRRPLSPVSVNPGMRMQAARTHAHASCMHARACKLQVQTCMQAARTHAHASCMHARPCKLQAHTCTQAPCTSAGPPTQPLAGTYGRTAAGVGAPHQTTPHRCRRCEGRPARSKFICAETAPLPPHYDVAPGSRQCAWCLFPGTLPATPALGLTLSFPSDPTRQPTRQPSPMRPAARS
eukprot:334419-Chlamydomonas_euryale.AAC.2